MEKLYVTRGIMTRLINIALRSHLSLVEVVQALLDFHGDDKLIIENLKHQPTLGKKMTVTEILDREA